MVDRKRYSRQHDYLYLELDSSEPPKESFKKIAELIRARYGIEMKSKKVLDVGCAVGHFPDYLSKEVPEAHIEGLEYVDSLVEKAQVLFPSLQIRQGSVLNENEFPEASFDTITLLGVLQIFDDPLPVLANLRRWLKQEGQLLIHGIFNPFPFDVFVEYSGSGRNGVRQKGWNVHSIDTAREILSALGFRRIDFVEFSLPFDLPPRLEDPLRSWTEIDSNGNRILINGLNLRQPQYIVECVT